MELLFLSVLGSDPLPAQGQTEKPLCPLACQRNVTVSLVQGQTGERSLQLSITTGADRDTHSELFLSFIRLLRNSHPPCPLLPIL